MRAFLIPHVLFLFTMKYDNGLMVVQKFLAAKFFRGTHSVKEKYIYKKKKKVIQLILAEK